MRTVWSWEEAVRRKDEVTVCEKEIVHAVSRAANSVPCRMSNARYRRTFQPRKPNFTLLFDTGVVSRSQKRRDVMRKTGRGHALGPGVHVGGG